MLAANGQYLSVCVCVRVCVCNGIGCAKAPCIMTGISAFRYQCMCVCDLAKKEGGGVGDISLSLLSNEFVG